MQDVIRHQEMTRVPLAPDTIVGLINLRGQIVTVIDLRARLELPRRRTHEPVMNAIVLSDEGGVSLLVDKIGDVVDGPDDLYAPPPEAISGIARELIKGVYKMENNLLLILDPEKTVDLLAVGNHEKRRDHPAPV